jgi:PTS system nitrogen regulatory IIA component
VKLTVRDAAELLGLPQDKVYRWIEAGTLPAYKMNDQYRINRAELLEWATSQGVPVSPQLFREPNAEAVPRGVADALAKGGVQRGVVGATKEETLRSVVRRLPLPPEVDRELLLDVLLAREALGSTGVGDGIAIPHVRNPIVLHVDEPLLSVVYLARPVDFDAIDGKPVKTLFTIVAPTVRTHLHLLSRLAFLLKQPRFRDAVAREADADELARLARELEAEAPRPKAAAR